MRKNVTRNGNGSLDERDGENKKSWKCWKNVEIIPCTCGSRDESDGSDGYLCLRNVNFTGMIDVYKTKWQQALRLRESHCCWAHKIIKTVEVSLRIRSEKKALTGLLQSFCKFWNWKTFERAKKIVSQAWMLHQPKRTLKGVKNFSELWTNNSTTQSEGKKKSANGVMREELAHPTWLSHRTSLFENCCKVFWEIKLGVTEKFFTNGSSPLTTRCLLESVER